MSRPEYVMDVPYVRSFMDDLSPARLRLVAALNGALPPPAEDFDYCDLGAGHGDSLVTLAAAYPKARFLGVDLNPRHVATARALAREGVVGNARFVEHDFADLAAADLPSFDYVCSHGVLSWIGPATRAAMLAFASAKLKPGGLFYVGYNLLPGWAVIEPLRRLLCERALAAEGSTAERATAALAFAQALARAGSRYFTRNEPVLDMLATMQKAGMSYVVHEYLHEHWVPMYFADLAGQLAALDLHFVGQLPVYLNDRDLAVPPAVGTLLKGVRDRVELESLMGYATNQFFRRDIYIKGDGARTDATCDAYLDATAFTPLGARTIPRTVKMPYHALDLVGEVFEALLPILEDEAAPLSELAARPGLQRYGITRARNAMRRLIVSGQVAPLLRAAKVDVPREGRWRLPSAFNRAVVERPLSSDAPFAFASPVAGTGIVLPRLSVVALRALTEAEPRERPGWVRAFCEEGATELQEEELGGERVPARAVLGAVERMRETQMGKLAQLGVVEERPASG